MLPETSRSHTNGQEELFPEFVPEKKKKPGRKRKEKIKPGESYPSPYKELWKNELHELATQAKEGMLELEDGPAARMINEVIIGVNKDMRGMPDHDFDLEKYAEYLSETEYYADKHGTTDLPQIQQVFELARRLKELNELKKISLH